MVSFQGHFGGALRKSITTPARPHTKKAPMITVVIADGHPVTIAGLKEIIGSTPDMMVVGEALDGLNALRLAESESPDVLLMDIGLPRIDGIALLKELRTRREATKVVFFVGPAGSERLYDALCLGCTGMLAKEAKPSLVIAGIRTALAQSGANGYCVCHSVELLTLQDSLTRAGAAAELKTRSPHKRATPET